MERWEVRKATISARLVMPGMLAMSFESRRREIAGITVSIDPVALGAVGESESTALSGIADLLRVGSS
jgi:hypothetical protein